MSNIDGILVIDKPEKITSFKVVYEIKKYLNIKKVGHMGTLDPMATGVLPIMLGRATKALDLIKNSEKKYVAKIKFGISTDTQDITGKIIKKSKEIVKYSDLCEALTEFTGEIFQVPPMYSAVKKNGKKLYELARKGQTIYREKRKIKIDEIEILDFNTKNQEATIKVSCLKGTYIRTLCSDIGDKLKVGAAMSELRRIHSNGFSIDGSLSLDQALKDIKDGSIFQKIIKVESLFMEYPKIEISQKHCIRFKSGASLYLSRLGENNVFVDKQKYRLYSEGDFIGLGEVNLTRGEMSVFKLFKV